MRIPFDLIAAVLLMDGISKYLIDARSIGLAEGVTVGEALAVWAGFLVVVWLLNELITRRVEWATRFGRNLSGSGAGMHPLEMHTWGIRIVQLLSVALFGAVLWWLQWPSFVENWPSWFGVHPGTLLRAPKWLATPDEDSGLMLGQSAVAAMFLNLAPYLLAMVISWIPRRRLASGIRRRPIPLLTFLAYEAKLTWLPLIPWLAISILIDISATLPAHSKAWMSVPGVDIALALSFMAILSVIILPKLVIWQWECKPLPDGALRDRMLALMERSGVRAKAIMVWGPRGSGLLNACVLGPWAPFRYVLISPALVDELGMEETEAVLAHELGHARYGHLTLLFIMILCMSVVLEPLTYLLPFSSPLAQAAFLVAFIILYIWGFFGTIMRQCEREADLASAELMGTPRPLVDALEKLAQISGNIRNVYCWHHGSIAQRVEAVQKLSVDPHGSDRFHTRLRRIRIAFALATALAIGVQFFLRLGAS
jgi:Zn-dependent protease with chaperone function